MATVFMLVGLTGAGKTTYARRVLEPAGAVRLSVDEMLFAAHGRYGVDYPADIYFGLYDEALEKVRAAMAREIAAGHDVVLDLGIWRRADRDDWKRRIEAAGARWRLLYFEVPRAELLRRLAGRNQETHANALTVTERDHSDFEARFDPPYGEGEERIPPGGTPAG